MNISNVIAQAGRTAKFHSPLGGDILVLTGFAGDEGINHLGQYRVEAMAVDEAVDLDSCLGRTATVEIATLAHGPRFFDGVVTEAELLGVVDNQDGLRSWNYRFILRPWFWLAGLRRNQRIFHDKTASDIIAEVLADYAGFPVEQRLVTEYEPLEYTVQYRETDLAFVCRIAERFGISWHFEHEKGSHKMVLADSADAYPSAPGETRPFRPIRGHHLRPEEHFSRWQAGRKVTTGRLTLTDYNFKTPDAAMLAEQSASHPYAQGEIESFDFPGGYLAQGAGNGVAKLRSDQEGGPDGGQGADGDTLSLAPGMVVGLSEHPDAGVNGQSYLVTRIDHHYEGESYRSGGSRAGSEGYQGHFRLFPATRSFTPAQVTPPAVMPGPQTAVVVGEGEIDCDEYGRILVKFHWDRHAAHSMRCRVSQSWAGGGWGGMVIPRIGMEVVVEFLEGDPDQPLVTGCVYNGKNGVPYALPQHKTKTILRSNSHQGTGYNEISFEDQAGTENIFFHAQKDMTARVLNNRAARVDKSSADSVGENRLVSTGNNLRETVGGSQSHSVGGGLGGAFGLIGAIVAAGGADALAGSEALGSGTISGFVGTLAAAGAALSAASDGQRDALDAAGSHQTKAGEEQTDAAALIAATLSSSMPMSGILTSVVEKFRSDTVGLAATEQVGAYKNVSVGHTMTVHVGQEFIINAGKSKFVMDADGNVTIIGTKFNFTASGNVQINGKVIDLN